MLVAPLAFDSFGVRSMATFVKAGKEKIIIDPGVALAPTRYGLKPTKQELLALELAKDIVKRVGKKCNIAIVTHYHYDHHPYPEDASLYSACFSGKRVFCKEFEKEHASARKRGKIFLEKARELAKSVELADGKEAKLRGCELAFSQAVWHGHEGSKVGRVIMVKIKEKRSVFLFGSDAQSLADKQALDYFIKAKPEFAIVDGFPTIFVGWRMSKSDFEKANENLLIAIRKAKPKVMILDHHIVRDINFREKMRAAFEEAKKAKVKLVTAAEFYGLPDFLLEAKRKELKKGEISEGEVESYYKKLWQAIKRKANL